MIIAIYGLDKDGLEKIQNYFEYLKTNYTEYDLDEIGYQVYPRPFGECYDVYVKGLVLTTLADRVRLEFFAEYGTCIEIFSKQFINVEIR